MEFLRSFLRRHLAGKTVVAYSFAVRNFSFSRSFCSSNFTLINNSVDNTKLLLILGLPFFPANHANGDCARIKCVSFIRLLLAPPASRSARLCMRSSLVCCPCHPTNFDGILYLSKQTNSLCPVRGEWDNQGNRDCPDGYIKIRQTVSVSLLNFTFQLPFRHCCHLTCPHH